MPYIDTTIKEQLPTRDQAKKALVKAQKPTLKDRDVRPYVSMLERLPREVPRLGGHISIRTAVLASFSWKIIPTLETDADRALEVEGRLSKAIRGLILNHVDPVLYQLSLIRLDWRLDPQKWTPSIGFLYAASDIEAISNDPAYPDGVAILQSDGKNFTRVAPQESGPTNGVRSSYITQIAGRELGGVLGTILFPALRLARTIRNQDEFNDNLKGLPVATYNELADPTAQATAEEVVTNVGTSQSAVIPDSVKFEHVKMVDAVGKDSYVSTIDQIMADIAIAVLGQANSSELPSSGGSRAALQELTKLLRSDLMLMDRLRVQAAINDQLLRQDWAYNVAEVVPTILPYRFEFIDDETEDTEANARIIEVLAQAGYKPALEEVQRKTGFKTLAETAAPAGGVL